LHEAGRTVTEVIMIINELHVSRGSCHGARFVLFGLRPNLASHFARSPLTHSYGYGSAGDRTNCLARFTLTLERFVQYAG
jgi:hypothetical protein